jgi:hypothetical protein
MSYSQESSRSCTAAAAAWGSGSTACADNSSRKAARESVQGSQHMVHGAIYNCGNGIASITDAHRVQHATQFTGAFAAVTMSGLDASRVHTRTLPAARRSIHNHVQVVTSKWGRPRALMKSLCAYRRRCVEFAIVCDGVPKVHLKHHYANSVLLHECSQVHMLRSWTAGADCRMTQQSTVRRSTAQYSTACQNSTE